jgi:hypothetical protein
MYEAEDEGTETEQQTTDGGDEQPKTDPPGVQKRIADIAKQRDAYKAKADGFDALAAERDALTARLAEADQKISGVQTSRALARAGVADDEHEAVLLSAYAAMAEDKRPASVVDYWNDVRSKPVAEWPRALRGFAPEMAAEVKATVEPVRRTAAGAPPAGSSESQLAKDLNDATDAARKNPTPENVQRRNDLHKALSDLLKSKNAR